MNSEITMMPMDKSESRTRKGISLSLAILAVLITCGCKAKNAPSAESGRYLYFTARFPPGFYWDVVTDFESKSQNPDCGKISGITGKQVPGTESESHPLRNSGDTVKVPLFFSRKSSCEYVLKSIAIQRGGKNCIMFHALVLLNDSIQSRQAGFKMMPDSLGISCTKTHSTDCYRCKENSGNVELGYQIPESGNPVFSIAMELGQPE